MGGGVGAAREAKVWFTVGELWADMKTCFHLKTHYILIQILFFCSALTSCDDIHASPILAMLKWDVNQDCR